MQKMNPGLFVLLLVTGILIAMTIVAVGDIKSELVVLRSRISKIEHRTRREKDRADGIKNWVRAMQAQVCIDLPTCEDLDRLWLQNPDALRKDVSK